MSDLISRQKAIEALANLTCVGIEEIKAQCDRSVADSEGWLGGIRDAALELEALPSAEPERKKGVWTGDCCSCCGVSKYNYIKMVDDECGPFGTWNFCPHCGARLEWK